MGESALSHKKEIVKEEVRVGAWLMNSSWRGRSFPQVAPAGLEMKGKPENPDRLPIHPASKRRTKKPRYSTDHKDQSRGARKLSVKHAARKEL